MTMMQTYQGVVHQGHIQLPATAELPEGSHVYVIVGGQEPMLAEPVARRKATRWLAEYVGNMLIAQEGYLTETEQTLVWRFGAFIIARGHKPRGPIGYVDVDAHNGNVLADIQKAEEMMAYGEAFIPSFPRAA